MTVGIIFDGTASNVSMGLLYSRSFFYSLKIRILNWEFHLKGPIVHSILYTAGLFFSLRFI